MHPVRTELSEITYRGRGDVVDLPCERQIDIINDEPITTIYAVWALTDEERAAIADGANVKLGIHGMEPIPPVSLQVTDERVLDEPE